MADRLYRTLLRLLPREVRDAYARDMETTFRTERRHTSPRQVARLWLSTIVDIIRTAPGYHWDILARDVRFSWRVLISRPLHLVTSAGTLALGLGASIAMFALIDAILLAPLPYKDSRNLVTLQETSKGDKGSNLGYLTFVDVRARARTVQSISAASQSTATLTGDGRDAERVNVMRTSASYFTMIGIQAAHGRTFTDAEDRPGPARRVAILSDALWRRRFGGDETILGRTIQVNSIAFTVVGIMPPDFQDLVASRLFQNAEMWTPLGYDPAASFACRTCRHLRVFARLNAGTDPSAAERDLSAILSGLATEHPKEYDRPGIRVIRLGDLFLGPVRPVLLILMGGVVLLLLVACGNVANLLLIRATEREQELAVRTALGVTAGKLVRQLLTESIMLALTGAALGLPLAWAAIRFVVAAAPPGLPRLADAALDVRAVSVALVLAVVTGIIFGLVPALQLRKQGFFSGLRDSARRTASAGTWRMRALLVAGNMTMAAVLVVTSGLVARSLMGLLAVNIGFDPEHVMTGQVSLSGPAYSTNDNAKNVAQTVAFYDRLLGEIRSVAGVQSAGAMTTLPLGGLFDGFGIHIAGRPLDNPESAPGGDRFVVTPGVFETLRIPLVRGRLLNDSDRQDSPMTAVVNAALARDLFPGEDAIGHAIKLGGPDTPPRTIVGIVGDVKHVGLDLPQTYQFYVPLSQWPWAETDLTVVVRTSGDANALAQPMRAALRDIDRSQPMTQVREYSDIVRAATGPRRIAAQVLSAFAGVALVLAAVGLYGALGVVAGQRRQEIGLRLALGADRGQIGRLLLLQGLRPAIAGLAAGLIITALAGGVLTSLLYGITGVDPATFAAAAAILSGAAVIACAIPARRASRTDPATALRAQ